MYDSAQLCHRNHIAVCPTALNTTAVTALDFCSNISPLLDFLSWELKLENEHVARHDKKVAKYCIRVHASCSVLHVLHLVLCLQIKWWNFTIYEFITVTVQRCRSWGGGGGAVAPHENIGVANIHVLFCPPPPIILTKYWGGKHIVLPPPPPITTWKIHNARIGLKSTVSVRHYKSIKFNIKIYYF